ncbi:carbohydrate ABC transporter permease [Devosia sp. A16]|uniref:carbohydrate ABC transporter permease n=1 Tax=Devosia sp. A16 TaxID=1736675 RepID=UPI0006D855CC|nr:carbohydrate ABC transporter permease [Devosia sp. A16]
MKPALTPMRILGFLVLAGFAFITLFPFYWMVMTAIMPTDAILSREPSLLPDLGRVRFDAFVKVFENRPFFTWIMNSLIVATASTLLSLFVSTLAGYSLSRFSSPPQQALGATLLVSKLIPASLILIPLFIIYTNTGLFNSLAGIVLANMTIGVPLATWLMKGFFDRIPRELEQAAMIDGASQLQAMRLVILPLAKPGLAASTVYLVLTSWSEFIFARTLVDKPEVQVLTVGMQSFVGEQMVDWSMLMAAGTISVLPAIVLFIFLEPFLVSGMTKGALAGT